MCFAPTLAQESIRLGSVDIEVVAVLFEERDRLLPRTPTPRLAVIAFDQSQSGRHGVPCFAWWRLCQSLAQPEFAYSLPRPFARVSVKLPPHPGGKSEVGRRHKPSFVICRTNEIMYRCRRGGASRRAWSKK